MNYETEKIIQDAIYVINHIVIGFVEKDKIEKSVYSRVAPNDPHEMNKIFLPEYCRSDAIKVIQDLETLLRKRKNEK
jgi:hypothetical protein